MQTHRALALVGLATTAAWAAWACDSSSPPPAPIYERDGSPGGPPADVEVPPADAQRTMTTMRLAHLSPDLGAVDFCYRGSGTDAFVGPVLGGGAPGGKDAGALDGDAAGEGDADARPDDAAVDAYAEADAHPSDAAAESGVPYLALTTYVSLAGSGTFDLALVDADAPSCANPKLVQRVTLDAGKLSTVVIMGQASADAGSASGLSILAFTDDSQIEAAKARTRFVHAALGSGARPAAPTLVVSAVSGQSPVLTGPIEPRHASTPSNAAPMVDALGYSTTDPIPPATALAIAEKSDGGEPGEPTWTSAFTDLHLTAGSLHTGFIVTNASSGFTVLWCTDTSAAGRFTQCTILEAP